MIVVTFPSGLPYGLALTAPSEFEELHKKSYQLHLGVTQLKAVYDIEKSASGSHSPQAIAAGDQLITAISDYNDVMDRCSVWVRDHLYDHLGIDSPDQSPQWAAPEEYAQGMLHWDPAKTPVYGVDNLPKEMPAIPFNGFSKQLHEILATLPPKWRLGIDFNIYEDEVVPLG